MLQLVNDNIIENIFKSINDFDRFYFCISRKEDLKLDNDVIIKFNEKLNIVEIYFKQNKYVINELTFQSIVKEFFQEIERQKQQQETNKEQLVLERKRDDIAFVGNQVHRVDISYINYMYEIKIMNAASTYNLYIKRLRRLEKIINIGDIIIIGDRKIRTIEDLVLFLTERGFQNLTNDFTKR